MVRELGRIAGEDAVLDGARLVCHAVGTEASGGVPGAPGYFTVNISVTGVSHGFAVDGAYAGDD